MAINKKCDSEAVLSQIRDKTPRITKQAQLKAYYKLLMDAKRRKDGYNGNNNSNDKR